MSSPVPAPGSSKLAHSLSVGAKARIALGASIFGFMVLVALLFVFYIPKAERGSCGLGRSSSRGFFMFVMEMGMLVGRSNHM